MKKKHVLNVLVCLSVLCCAGPLNAAKVAVETGARLLPTVAWLVGTYDTLGRPDMAVIDRTGIAETAAGQNMAFYVSVAPSRQTAMNIESSGAFTVNIMTPDIVAQGDYCGSVSAASGGTYFDKFAVTGLELEKSGAVNAPVLARSPLVLECRLLKTQDFADGKHRMYFGEVVGYRVEASNPNGDRNNGGAQFDPVKSQMLVFFAGGSEKSGYYKVSKPYGRADRRYGEKYPDGGGLLPKRGH